MTEYIDRDATLRAMWNALFALEDAREEDHGLDLTERHNIQSGFEAGQQIVANAPTLSAEDMASQHFVDAVIKRLRTGYFNEDLQMAKNDPCIVDAMIDWSIRQVKAVREEEATGKRWSGSWVIAEERQSADGTSHQTLMCPKCGFTHVFIDHHTSQYNFCPQCGARLEF